MRLRTAFVFIVASLQGCTLFESIDDPTLAADTAVDEAGIDSGEADVPVDDTKHP